ncbi:hypothetical protein KP509_20G092100 [Ceratopteris richardii]|nr:hypothetical protein KP509_1Z254100 [Ceratopteris richardii]KAH7332514.1 hypothetical protein KP509_20G092100 [Ceratopteris richardii]
MCAKQRDLQLGAYLHAEVIKMGILTCKSSVANAVIEMYSKCGLLSQAHLVLELVPMRNVVSWTLLITGYVNHGFSQEALKCYSYMLCEGINPDRVIVACILRACCSEKEIDKIQQVHIDCERMGLLKVDNSIGTMLVDVYCICGLLNRARQVFDRLSKKDTVAWTTLIQAYSNQNRVEEALHCFDEMQRSGVLPDAVAFACILRACSSLRATDKVKNLHEQINIANLLLGDNVVGTALVDAYAKCGEIDTSIEVFNMLKVQDVVSWTAIMDGCIEQGNGEKALSFLKRMEIECVLPNAITFSCSLKACSTIEAIRQGRWIHCQAESVGLLEQNKVVGNTLVDMYIKCGSITRAHEVFDRLPSRDVISWTSLIAGYTEHGYGEISLKCFEHMQLEGVTPNSITYLFCLRACANIGVGDKGEEIHARIEDEDLLEGDAILANALLDMYAALGMFDKAQQVFDKLLNDSVISWTALIERIAEHGYAQKALDCFDLMQKRGVHPNDVTLLVTLRVSGIAGAIDKVQLLHAEVERLRLIQRRPVGNVLLFAYCKCGCLELAHEVFERLQFRDPVSWNSLIGGYTQLGDTVNALSIFNQMQEQGSRPGSITFTNVLNALNRQGLLQESQTYFEAIGKDFGIIAAPEHLCGMLDIFCRMGDLRKAKSLMDTTLSYSNITIWHSFLAACRSFQNLEIGKWAFDHAMHVDELQMTNPTSISPFYGGQGIHQAAD